MHYIKIRSHNVLWCHKTRDHHNGGCDAIIKRGHISVFQYLIFVIRWSQRGVIPSLPLHHFGGIFVEWNDPPRGNLWFITPHPLPQKLWLSYQNILHVDLVTVDVLSIQVFQKGPHNYLHGNGWYGVDHPKDMNKPQNVGGVTDTIK